MGLFDRFKKEKADTTAAKPVEEVKPKPSGGHGSHWEIALTDMTLLQKIVMDALAKPNKVDRLEGQTPHFGKSSIAVGYKVADEALTVVGVVVNGQIYSAYPQNTKTNQYNSIVDQVSEWQNELESWVKCEVQGAGLDFFPTDYYKNKDKYVKGQSLSIDYSAFAYAIGQAEEWKFSDKEGRELTTKTMCAILPYSKSPFPDDYWFRGEIKDEITLGENKVYKTRLINYDKDEDAFEVWIYCQNRNIKGTFKKGDYISGILWLQGCIQ